MELTNDFVIDRPVDETWKILNDLEFIAPCMPGAQLQEIEGDEYRGTVKIKVGPISAQYKGKASFQEQDAVNKKAVLKAEGRDPRQGNANAFVTANMEPVGDGSSTKVTIHTDLKLSGKVASFGRGIIEDVSKSLLGQFTENLRIKLADEASKANAAEELVEEAAAAPASADTPAADAGATTSSAKTTNTASTVRKISAPEAEPVDLLAVTGDPIMKRVGPVLGVVLLLLVLRWLLGARRG